MILRFEPSSGDPRLLARCDTESMEGVVCLVWVESVVDSVSTMWGVSVAVFGLLNRKRLKSAPNGGGWGG
jgi:hypothetical protein